MAEILVIVERTGGQIDDSTWELATLARKLSNGGPVAAAVLGDDTSGDAAELTRWFDEVWVFDAPRLAVPGDVAAVAAVEGLLEQMRPSITLMAHTNVAMDMAPGMAFRRGVSLVADCLELDHGGDGLRAVRTLYGGKVHARVSVRAGENGFMATIRPGAIAASEEAPDAGGTTREGSLPAEMPSARRVIETVEPDPSAVDITQAEILVCVGRGIEEEDDLEMIRDLAASIGGQIACTRPIVDKGWLGKNYQVGTSGVTVKPKVYIAVGVSGSFQHMGGVKGSPFIAAVNKDPAAPIFSMADVGVVGDLFDFVPVLEEKIREAKG